MPSARAEVPQVRVGPFDVQPYVLVQEDEGGTVGQTREGGQATGFNTRRARLGARAKDGGVVELGLVYDFGAAPGDGSRLFEADVAFTGLKPLVVRAGIFKPAFTLEYAQAAADTVFLERAAIVDVVGGLVAGAGRTGLQLGASGERWFAAGFLTGGRTGPGAKSGQRAALGRVAGLAVRTDATSLHLGMSGAWLFQVDRGDGGRRALAFANGTELQVDTVDPALSTGSLPATGARLGGIEAGLSHHRLWLQSEAYVLRVDRGGGRPDLSFSGWYAQAAFTVLGTPRRWKHDIAAWTSPAPAAPFDPAAGQWGALEVAARFSAIRLNDADVRGGRQEVWTAGVNWFPAEALRFTLQYQRAQVTDTAQARRLHAIGLRGQLRF